MSFAFPPRARSPQRLVVGRERSPLDVVPASLAVPMCLMDGPSRALLLEQRRPRSVHQCPRKGAV